MRQSTRWGVVVALGVALAGCATNPVTGRREISLVSPAQEKQLGGEGFKAALQEYGRYEDADLQSYVNTVGQKVARASHQPDLGWTFTIVDDPAVNAFAMPGGYIFVTRGILPYLNSEAQLAAVLGHECGHVTHRHTAEQITQQQLYGLGLGLASAFSPTFQRFSGVAQQALQLLFLKYSRADETQADELGVQYSTGASYDAREMPATYTMLKRVSDKAGQRLPGFLSTHPDPGDREVRTRQLAQQATAGRSNLVIRHSEYIRTVDNVVYGSDPRQGYFVADQYYSPNLTFQMTLPSGWQHQDSRSAVLAAAPQQAAAMQLTLADAGGLSPEAYVAQLQTKGTIVDRDGRTETIGGYPAWVGRLAVPSQQQQSPTTLDAAFIQKDGRMFQILGQSQHPGDANEAEVFTSARSFRTLSDPARLNVTPDRVRVAAAPATGTLSSIVQRLGSRAADVEDDAILNNVQAGDTIRAGTLVKYIVRGR
jgi:predicted Zn-dependent protease